MLELPQESVSDYDGFVSGLIEYLFNQLGGARARPMRPGRTPNSSILEEYYEPLREENQAGSVRDVNRVTRGSNNCVNCSIATDAMLSGRPASALGGSPTSISVLETHFGRSFSDPVSVQSMRSDLLEAGNGARGIVYGSRGPGEVGHVFNAVNQGGTVRFLDGQSGGPAILGGYSSFRLLRTN